ncbi:MAG TPA: hypothetical protein VHO90_16265 [Bacteroidales bacterium]|nr:hypothetical protein [Bacteroidales bacterium]
MGESVELIVGNQWTICLDVRRRLACCASQIFVTQFLTNSTVIAKNRGHDEYHSKDHPKNSDKLKSIK